MERASSTGRVFVSDSPGFKSWLQHLTSSVIWVKSFKIAETRYPIYKMEGYLPWSVLRFKWGKLNYCPTHRKQSVKSTTEDDTGKGNGVGDELMGIYKLTSLRKVHCFGRRGGPKTSTTSPRSRTLAKDKPGTSLLKARCWSGDRPVTGCPQVRGEWGVPQPVLAPQAPGWLRESAWPLPSRPKPPLAHRHVAPTPGPPGLRETRAPDQGSSPRGAPSWLLTKP